MHPARGPPSPTPGSEAGQGNRRVLDGPGAGAGNMQALAHPPSMQTPMGSPSVGAELGEGRERGGGPSGDPSPGLPKGGDPDLC